MKTTLALSVTGAQLALEVLQPLANRRVTDLVRPLSRFDRAAKDGTHEVKARVELAASPAADVFAAQLDELLAGLKTIHRRELAGSELTVQLGLSLARVGVMVLADVSAHTLPSAACEAYVHAWVGQVQHLEPASQVIRWEILGPGDKILVSCVQRAHFEALTHFAATHHFRFVSCRPALLAQLAAEREKARNRQVARDATVVWTESTHDGHRSNIVQLLRVTDSFVTASWRGWLPFLPVGSDHADDELHGAVRRFQVRHQAGGDDQIRWMQWPLVSTAQHTAA